MKKKPNESVVKAEIAAQDERPPVDFTKEWTNGHKFFTSPESRAFVELLHTEDRTRERHEALKHLVARPRNPLWGDPTPRDHSGEVVMNPKLLHTVKTGSPLYVEHDLATTQSILSKYSQKPPVGKIGVKEENYNVLGNTDAPVQPAVSEDLRGTTGKIHQEKLKKFQEREKINEYIAREKALRHQKELARQMKLLHKQMEEKEKEMHFIQTQYRL